MNNSDTPRTDELAKRDFVPDGVWIRHARELERENAALRNDKERLDWMASADYWADIAVYRTPEGFRAAIDAARKEAQPCQCTNGIIRSVGRDNGEIIEDCPRCLARKET